MKRSAVLGFAVAAATCAFGELMVKEGDTLAFLGDSITQFGQQKPDGYVNLTIRALAEAGVEVKAVKAGISGHKSDNMLARLNRDVLSKKPRWMTLSCGVNDVWHQDSGKGVLIEADVAQDVLAVSGDQAAQVVFREHRAAAALIGDEMRRVFPRDGAEQAPVSERFILFQAFLVDVDLPARAAGMPAFVRDAAEKGIIIGCVQVHGKRSSSVIAANHTRKRAFCQPGLQRTPISDIISSSIGKG